VTRLTSDQRRDRHTSGAELQVLVVELATIYGWSWVHFRPARTERGWRTPVEGPLGKGWPDLVLIRERDGRIVFAELKREQGDDLSADQYFVLEYLRAAGQEVHVWRPSDFTEGRVGDVLS
jgi:hypothetical protein